GPGAPHGGADPRPHRRHQQRRHGHPPDRAERCHGPVHRPPRLRHRERHHGDGRSRRTAAPGRRHPGVLPRGRHRRQLLARREALQAAQAVAVVTEPLLEATDLTLRFGGNTALDGVSLDVRPGELLAVIGPNGAGKTSTFNCISGVYRPQEGTVTFRGRPLTGLKPDRVAGLGIARTFQNIELFENLTVLDNLLLGRHQQLRAPWWQAMAWLPRARREEYAARREVEYIIDFLELEAVRHAPVGILPYGIKKRIELGRALAMDPRLLLLDEPVAGMNAEETEDM